MGVPIETVTRLVIEEGKKAVPTSPQGNGSLAEKDLQNLG
jgi:hypothetical protein